MADIVIERSAETSEELGASDRASVTRWTPGAKVRLLVGALIVGSLLLLHVWSLLRYPAPYVDEAWLASRAWAFKETGVPFGALDVGIFDRVDEGWRCVPLIPTWIQSLGMRFIRYPAISAIRTMSLVFGLILLAVIYAIGARLHNFKFGVLASIMVALSSPFFYSAHLGRSDIFAAAFGFGAIALYLCNSRERIWMALLSGSMLSLALEIHPHAAVYGPALLFLFIFDYKIAIFRRPHFWAFVLGNALGLSLYAAIHILPNPDSYFAFGRLAFGPTHTPPILTFDVAVITQACAEFVGTLEASYSYLTLPFVLALLLLLATRTDTARRLAIIIVGTIIGFILLVRNKQNFYIILYSPVIDLAISYLLVRAIEWKSEKRLLNVTAKGALVGLIVLATLANLPLIEQNAFAEYSVAQNEINSVIEPNDSVMGRQQYWFGLYDHRFYPWESLVYRRRQFPGTSMEEAFAEKKPDIFILDQGNGKFFSDSSRNGLMLEHLRLPAAETRAFLEKRGEILTEFTSIYGRTRVYRIHWDK